jgi:tetratricopeptide (TPR) repeat protein
MVGLAAQDVPDAESILRELLETQRKAFGPDSPQVFALLRNLGSCLHAARDFAGAAEMYRAAKQTAEKIFSSDHPNRVSSGFALALALLALGNLEEAEAHAREALEKGRVVFGVGHPQTLAFSTTLAVTLFLRKDTSAAEAVLGSISETNRVRNSCFVNLRVGRWHAALEDSEKWRVTDAQDPEPLYNLAGLYLKLKDDSAYDFGPDALDGLFGEVLLNEATELIGSSELLSRRRD